VESGLTHPEKNRENNNGNNKTHKNHKENQCGWCKRTVKRMLGHEIREVSKNGMPCRLWYGV